MSQLDDMLNPRRRMFTSTLGAQQISIVCLAVKRKIAMAASPF